MIDVDGRDTWQFGNALADHPVNKRLRLKIPETRVRSPAVLTQEIRRTNYQRSGADPGAAFGATEIVHVDIPGIECIVALARPLYYMSAYAHLVFLYNHPVGIIEVSITEPDCSLDWKTWNLDKVPEMELEEFQYVRSGEGYC